MGRYRWGATQSYQNLKNRDLDPVGDGTPEPLTAGPDARLGGQGDRAGQEGGPGAAGAARSRRSRRCASSPGGAGDAAHDDAATEERCHRRSARRSISLEDGPTARQGAWYDRWRKDYQYEQASSREDFVIHPHRKYGGRLPVWAAVELLGWAA